MKPALGFAGLGALLFPVLHLGIMDTMGIDGSQMVFRGKNLGIRKSGSFYLGKQSGNQHLIGLNLWAMHKCPLDMVISKRHPHHWQAEI